MRVVGSAVGAIVMNASQRRRHALTWLFLPPALVAMLVLALANRPPADATPGIRVEEPGP